MIHTITSVICRGAITSHASEGAAEMHSSGVKVQRRVGADHHPAKQDMECQSGSED
jgi:hypothetical protein